MDRIKELIYKTEQLANETEQLANETKELIKKRKFFVYGVLDEDVWKEKKVEVSPKIKTLQKIKIKKDNDDKIEKKGIPKPLIKSQTNFSIANFVQEYYNPTLEITSSDGQKDAFSIDHELLIQKSKGDISYTLLLSFEENPRNKKLSRR
jgi:hypothetical protein